MHLRTSSAVLGLGLVAAALAGCTSAPVSPTATPATSTPTPTPSVPAIVPDGSADDNLPVFAAVMNAVWERSESVRGRDYIDALEAVGFDRAAMEVTRDETTVGNPADSIQFSVLWQEYCLIGQVGPSVEAPTAVVMPELPSGGCLVGLTRPIDW